MLVYLFPLQRCMMIRERNMGNSFYGQNSSRLIPFFDSRLFISKGISLFIQMPPSIMQPSWNISSSFVVLDVSIKYAQSPPP